MASKRAHAESDSGSLDEPDAKRSRSKARSHQSSHIDPTWGQKYVFSNLDDATTVPVDSDVECEGDAEAMAYLQSVRQQASGIPHLLVAPKVPIGPQLPEGLRTDDQTELDEHTDRAVYDNGTGDFRGRYEDGAYIGQPDAEWDEAARRRREAEEGEDWDYSGSYTEEDAEAQLHDAYYAAILDRYHHLRERLQIKPPEEVVAQLPTSQGYYVGRFGPKTSVFSQWTRRLRDTDPWPAQVASMDKDAVIRVLRILLSGKLLRRGYELRERTSRWLWALLARLPDRGELNHVDIGWVRDLGRRAVLMTQSLADMANLREALQDEGMDLGVHEAIDESSDDEDVLRDMEVEEEDGEGTFPQQEASPTRGETPPADEAVAEAQAKPQAPEAPEPEQQSAMDDDQKSEAMDCSEDGEVAEDDEDKAAATEAETLEAAKARILAQLDAPRPEEQAPDEAEAAQSAEEQMRARLNMRATLNMILTVAGEFYGQRDLLEFRDPFTGM